MINDKTLNAPAFPEGVANCPFGDGGHSCEAIKELQKANAFLSCLLAVAAAEMRALASKVDKLEENAKTNSRNSSLPPSSDIFKAKKGKVKQHGSGKSKNHQGAQPGHKGKGRKLLDQSEIDHTVVCLPTKHCGCGGEVVFDREKHQKLQQFELPRIKPVVTEYQKVYGVCGCCGKSHKGELPAGIPNTLLGPQAIASIGVLSGDYHLSKRSIQKLLGDFFGLSVSLGVISNAEKTVSSALEKPVEEARSHIQEQATVVHADETSHKRQGNKMWMWLAVTTYVAVFMIRSSRCMNSAKALLGEGFVGFLISDRFPAYNWLQTTLRQFCWAHLKRDFQKVSERSGKAGRIGDEILDYIRRMFRLWKKLKAGGITRGTFQEAMIPIRENIERLLLEGGSCGHAKTENTCKKVLKFRDALWTFVDKEGVEPTNNLAEQQVRPYVIWRKCSFGTQSARGDQFVERIMTVTATCKLQGRSPYRYITEAVEMHLKNEPAPSLLSAPKARKEKNAA